MITIEEALSLVDRAIKPERLNSIQELILIQCWSNKTYQEIANDSGYDPDYVRVVGSRLWQLLSESLGEKITKNNFRSVLRQQTNTVEQDNTTNNHLSALELPDTPVPLNSAFYVQRSPIEKRAYEEITKPGALIKVKAPRKMGKTSLLMRIVAQAQSYGYHTFRLNLLQAESSILGNLERLLRWFCANLTLQLGLESMLDDYWDKDLGLKVSCTNYIQKHILTQLNIPLVVTIDEVNQLFAYPQVAGEFLALLRFWHEEANNIPDWEKLRVVVTCSTETFRPLDLHQSPFNVGLSLELQSFNWQQVQELAKRYGLDRDKSSIQLEQLQSLEQIIDGHPYLLNLAFYHLVTQNKDLDKLIEEAATDTGIYRSHLRSHLIAFRKSPELAMAYKQVVQATEPITLDSLAAYKLENMGLVKLNGNATEPLCELYRRYFRDRL